MTGIGFLGAGAIIRQGLSVRGLTTAATLWVVAAIGSRTGAGYYSAAVITTLVALVSLWPLRIVSHVVIGRFRPESGRVLAQLPPGERPAPLVTEVERSARGCTRRVGHEGDRRTVVLDVALPRRRRRARRSSRSSRTSTRSGGPLGGLRVRLCSQNANKLRELAALLPGWELELLDADGYRRRRASDSYYENARGKARFGRAVGPAEAWMLGEDSGIEVAALGGAPGRPLGPLGAGGRRGDRAAARELRARATARARYVCELVRSRPDGEERRGTGMLEGRIAERAARRPSGFGYDPVFVPDGEEQTVAELGDDWKRATRTVRALPARC